MTVKIEDLCKWSTPTRVNTRQGPKDLRKAPPTPEFWRAWKASKDQLKDAGVSCTKDGQEWRAMWWMPIPEQEQKAKAKSQAQSRATDSKAVIPCPEGLAFLPYQKAGVAYASVRPCTLLADQMGLGKTIQAIGVYNVDPSIKKVLIICPASLRLNWAKEWAKWSVRPGKIHVVVGGAKTAWNNDADIYIINYDVLDKHRSSIDKVKWDLLVADEVHKCKNPKAKRTKALFGFEPQKKSKAEPVEPIRARRKLFLTGTPIVNRPIELWPVVRACDPEGLGRSFFGFAKRYTKAHHNGWGWDFTGADRLPELQSRMREQFMVRRLKADVLKDLPPKRRQVIEIPANGAGDVVSDERRIFDNHQAYIEDLETRIEEAISLEDMLLAGDLRRELGAQKRIAFEEMSKARHEVGLAKVPHVIEHLETALEGGPVVCFAHHKDVVAAIQEAFPNSVSVIGGVSMDDRQKAVEMFQAGEVPLFIGNIQAAGVGLTLTASSHVVFAELDWVPGNLTQAEDRCHRIGQQEHVLVQHIVFEDSVDSIMVETLIEKQEVIREALDDEPVDVQPFTPVEDIEMPAKSEARKKTAESVRKVSVKLAEPEPRPVTQQQEEAARVSLLLLSGRCDGAMKLDGQGFNKFDSRVGKELAVTPEWTPRQAEYAVKLAVKYQRQLSPDLVTQAKGQ